MQFEILIEEGLVGIVTVVAAELSEPLSPSKTNGHVSNLFYSILLILDIDKNRY